MDEHFESGTFEMGLIVKIEQIAQLNLAARVQLVKAIVTRYFTLCERMAPGNPAHVTAAIELATLSELPDARTIDRVRLELEDDMSAAEEDEDTLLVWILSTALWLVDAVGASDEEASLKAAKAAAFAPMAIGEEVDAIFVDEGLESAQNATSEENAFVDAALKTLAEGGTPEVQAPSWAARLVSAVFE